MKYINIPIGVISLQVKTYGADDPLFLIYPGEALFDNSDVLAINDKQSTLAVLLNFSNGRALNNASASGLRRKVSVSLLDTTDSCVVTSNSFSVYMKRGEETCVKRVDFPLACNAIDCDHTFRLTVCDYKSGTALGGRDILFYHEQESGEQEAQVEETPHDVEDDSGIDFDTMLQEFIDSEYGYPNDDEFLDDDDQMVDDEPKDTQEDEPEENEGSDQTTVVPLSQLTGLTSVKEKLALYEKVVKFNKMRLDHHLSSNMLPLHAMFLGSPGTGKTTVAKNIGQILRTAGVLSKGHVVERQRSTLLGPNYSMEETNTLDAIEEAQGGILFIDEAYQLYQPNDPRDPGRLVIETLMTALADESRRDWMLILAGYPDEMRRMFEMNPGLRSRIPESNIYTFDDFTEQELMDIAENYLRRNSYRLSAEAHKALACRFAADYKQRDKKFGNARYVINMIQTEILPAMAARVVAEPTVNQETLSVIQLADIPPQPRQTCTPRPRIGFHV